MGLHLMLKNLNSSLRRKKKHRDPMKCYDELPYELRQWLASALLSWDQDLRSKLMKKPSTYAVQKVR